MNRKISQSLAISLCAAAAIAAAGCEQQGPAERAGEEIDQAMEEGAERVEEATDEVGGQLEEAGDELRERASQ